MFFLLACWSCFSLPWYSDSNVRGTLMSQSDGYAAIKKYLHGWLMVDFLYQLVV